MTNADAERHLTAVREAVRRVRSAAGPQYAGRSDAGAGASPAATDPGDDAWGAVWLHGDWPWLTRCMTTEAREYAAAAVLRWMHGLDAVDGRPPRGEPEELRWWRDA